MMMMKKSYSRSTPKNSIQLQDLPPFQPDETAGTIVLKEKAPHSLRGIKVRYSSNGNSFTAELVRYFKLLASSCITSKKNEVHIPSAIQLSGFFRCSEMQVLEALNHMNTDESLGYEICGLDLPILIRSNN